MPTKCGGLGIREPDSNIKALLAWTCWKNLFNLDLLCTQIPKAKYCPNKLLWEASMKKGGSWFWKGFVETLKLINENIGCG